jgi:hypothetical protein
MPPSYTPFSVRLVGQFYTLGLYDEHGRYIHDLDTAAAEAERQFGPDWREVGNGQQGISRDEWLELKSRKDTP